MLKPKTSGIKPKTREERKKANERTTPVVTRTTSKNKLKPTETYESGQQTTANGNNIQNPTSTPTSSNSSFLNTSLSPLHAGSFNLQTPSYCLEPQTETQQPSTPMDTNQPSTSTGINLLSILNKTLDGAKEKMRELESLQEEQTMRTTPQQQSLQEDGKNLKATLIALAKASHHKTFMETCLTRNQPPKNMKPWIEPHIYRSNTTIERKWRDILHNASLNLVSLLINHFGSIIREETLKLRALEEEMAKKISHKQEETEIWATICQEAQEEATQLSTKLKESREKKLSYRRKRWTQEEDMEEDYSEPLQKRQKTKEDSEETDIQSLLQTLASAISKNEKAPFRGARQFKGRGRGRGRYQ